RPAGARCGSAPPRCTDKGAWPRRRRAASPWVLREEGARGGVVLGGPEEAGREVAVELRLAAGGAEPAQLEVQRRSAGQRDLARAGPLALVGTQPAPARRLPWTKGREEHLHRAALEDVERGTDGRDCAVWQRHDVEGERACARRGLRREPRRDHRPRLCAVA